MWCTRWLFSPMGIVLRRTRPGFLWTQKWKSINNLNFFEENFSSLMNIQAWLQLNSEIEFRECFLNAPSMTNIGHKRHGPQGDLGFKENHTLPFQPHIKMRQLNCNNIYLNQSWEMAWWVPNDTICDVNTQRVLKANTYINNKEPNQTSKYFISYDCLYFK